MRYCETVDRTHGESSSVPNQPARQVLIHTAPRLSDAQTAASTTPREEQHRPKHTGLVIRPTSL